MNELRVTENSWSSHLQLPNAGNSGMPCPVQYDTCFFVTLLLLIIDKVKSETKASSSRLGSPEGNVIMWTYLVGSAWAWMTLSILLSLYPTMWWVSNTGFSLLAATFSMKPLIIFISATVIKQPDKKNHLRSERVCFISQFQDSTSPSLWEDKDDTGNSMYSQEPRCKNTLRPRCAQSPLYSSTVWNPNLGDGAAQNGQNFVSWLKATATDTPTEQPDVDTPHKDPLSRWHNSRLYHVNN